jgi:hypothetical protein
LAAFVCTAAVEGSGHASRVDATLLFRSTGLSALQSIRSEQLAGRTAQIVYSCLHYWCGAEACTVRWMSQLASPCLSGNLVSSILRAVVVNGLLCRVVASSTQVRTIVPTLCCRLQAYVVISCLETSQSHQASQRRDIPLVLAAVGNLMNQSLLLPIQQPASLMTAGRPCTAVSPHLILSQPQPATDGRNIDRLLVPAGAIPATAAVPGEHSRVYSVGRPSRLWCEKTLMIKSTGTLICHDLNLRGSYSGWSVVGHKGCCHPHQRVLRAYGQ